jgi:hypothetical protein
MHPSLVLWLLPCTLVSLFLSSIWCTLLAYYCCLVTPLFCYFTLGCFLYLDWYFPLCIFLVGVGVWSSIQLVIFFQFFKTLLFKFSMLLNFYFFHNSKLLVHFLVIYLFIFLIIAFFLKVFFSTRKSWRFKNKNICHDCKWTPLVKF